MHLENVSSFLKSPIALDSKYFSDQAILHMTDVKNLFGILYGVMLVTVIIFTVSLISLYKKDRNVLLKLLKAGSLLTLYISVLTASLFFFNFAYFFEKIHIPLFSNNLWIFEPGDNLIKLFPLEFFISFTKYMFFFILFCAVLIYIAAKIALSHDKPRN